MKTSIASFACVAILLFACRMAFAYGHANRFGGSTSHSWGDTTHTSAFGTSTSHSDYYGGTTSHQGVDGRTAYGSAGYYGYHPTATAASYGAACYHCGSAWATRDAAALTGAAIAADVAASSDSSGDDSDSDSSSVSTVPAADTAPGPPSVDYTIGQIFMSLPAECGGTLTIKGSTYYICGDAFVQPAYGANGLYYRVVPTP